MDPIADEFAWVNTYNYAENEPVAHIDLHGLQALDYSAKFQEGSGVKLKEQHGRIAKDIATIVGGAALVYGTAGAASPWVVAGGVMGGTYGMASGSAQLVEDIRGNSQRSDAIPETAAGFLAQPVDLAMGGEKRLAEKMADFGQNSLLLANSKNLAEGAVNMEQFIDALSGLTNEIENNTNNNKKRSKKSHTIPFGDETISPAPSSFSKFSDFNKQGEGMETFSSEEKQSITNFIKE